MDIPIQVQLQQEGIVILNERIDQAVKVKIVETVLAMTMLKRKSMVILIDCTGGDIEMAMQLYDIIRYSGLSSYGIVVGECSSSAMLVLQACQRRYALPRARFMCHTLSFTYKSRVADESIEGFRVALEGRMQLSRQFENLLCSRGISPDVLQQLKVEGDSGKLFTVETAVTSGLLDGEISDLCEYVSLSEAA